MEKDDLTWIKGQGKKNWSYWKSHVNQKAMYFLIISPLQSLTSRGQWVVNQKLGSGERMGVGRLRGFR